jgi:hypothetical protein
MAKRSRPSLTSLSAKVGSVSREAISAPEPKAAPEQLTNTSTRSTNEDRAAIHAPKLMQVGVNRPGWLEMTRLAQDLGTSVEDLMVASFNDALLKHGRPPVVEGQKTAPVPLADVSKVSSQPPSPLIWPGFAGAWWWYDVVAAPILRAWSNSADIKRK